MDAAVRRFVRERAGGRWEYCQFDQEDSEIPHHIEHIVARQHGGSDEPENLALACNRCNLHKGANLAGIDPAASSVEVLLRPGKDVWAEYFRMRQNFVEGLTPSRRATVPGLALTDTRRLELRLELSKLRKPN